MLAYYLASRMKRYEDSDLKDGLEDSYKLLEELYDGDLRLQYSPAGFIIPAQRERILRAMCWIDTAYQRF